MLCNHEHEKSEFFTFLGPFAVILLVCVTKVAKSALEKALAEDVDIDGVLGSPQLPIVGETPVDLNQPLLIKVENVDDNHEKWKI